MGSNAAVLDAQALCQRGADTRQVIHQYVGLLTCSGYTLLSSSTKISEYTPEWVITTRIKCCAFSREGKIKIVFPKEKGPLGPTRVIERPHDETIT